MNAMYMLLDDIWKGTVNTLIVPGTETNAYDGAPFAGTVQVTFARLLTVK